MSQTFKNYALKDFQIAENKFGELKEVINSDK